MTMTLKRALLAALSGSLMLAMLALSALPSSSVLAETGSNWQGQYWNNPDLTGSPVVTRTDQSITFNWQTGSPDASIPGDNFSARWTLSTNFNSGFFRFRLGSDDGARLFIDNIQIIDRWAGTPGGFGESNADVNLGAGTHTLRVEFVERTGNAGVLFEWTPIGAIGGGTISPFTPAPLLTLTPTPFVYGALCEIIIDNANIRPDPSTNNPPIGRAPLGKRFTMIGTNDDGTWFQIDLGNGLKGWLARRVIYLYPGSTDNLAVTGVSVAPDKTAVGGTESGTGVANAGLIMRDGPSRRGEKVGAVEKGETFVIIAWGQSNRAWVQIRLSNGQTGWVFIPFITITSGNLNRLPIHD